LSEDKSAQEVERATSERATREKRRADAAGARKQRVGFVGICAIVGTALGALYLPGMLESISRLLSPGNDGLPYTKYILIYPAMGLLGFMLGVGFARLSLQLFARAFGSWERMAIGDKVDIFIGLFAGIIASVAFFPAFQGLPEPGFAPLITLCLMLGFSAIALYGLKSISEVLPWHKSAGTLKSTGVKILDTNVLIDGRLYDIVRTGFLTGELYIPSFVLNELQYIADSSDGMRRQRGRRGLEVLRHLQQEADITVGTYDKFAPDDREAVDERLVRLAKAIGGDLISNDYNLNRVARIQDVKVLNVNDLALALRPNVLPGEMLNLSLIREGNQHNQAVGYLDDGTMVVVEHGKPYIGETVDVAVTQVIQTERGKMIFASMEGLEGPSNGLRRK
jgi:uncharacterized protein YacL